MLWFAKHKDGNEKNKQQGLIATVDDLLQQQKYLPYLVLYPNKLTSNRAGDAKSVFKGRGMEFAEVRAYTYDDDVRDIDWRVTARKKEPYTKVFNEERDREIVVFLDLSASMLFGTRHELKSVTAAKTAALIGWQTIRNKDRFGVIIFDGKDVEYYKPQNDIKSLIEIFRHIAQKTQDILNYDTNRKDNLKEINDALGLLHYYQKGQGTLFVISDFADFDSEKLQTLAMLARKHQIYCVNIFDALEENAPADGIYTAQYNGIRTTINSHNLQFKAAYYAYFNEKRAKLKKNCQKFLCRYMEIRTDIPIFKQLSNV